MAVEQFSCEDARFQAITNLFAIRESRKDLKMSPSEVHGAIKRLQQARLLHGPEMEDKPNLSALEEFLQHGVKYAFPAEHGQLMRGLPTSFAAPP